jgi:hypothetical protein
VDAGPILGLPYTLALNDVTTYQISSQPDGALADRVLRAMEVHRREAADNPVVVPIGLHPHIMGVSHRIGEIEQIVAAVTSASDILAVTSSQLYRWYADQVPAP